ncbi:D-mannonate dehydratase ManD [Brachybacterium alimentarium]|uniref:Bifunctional D-altronate/D-mannonate dehydratase n=1 Tax=Brachybacterium alimentarium TaxID=47845 RepID=A0A2A3YPB9_9MICO|nr:D-mannonate dehydratase ManD [Brachybacterium alimentarium]PCC35485.1 bifunctional D-altronate/D-mannonate dehydratase [Brachybacterium alimentarium]PCC41104.1 bifunctional D-altronate/D-mannonate dehydratase [Brachybacterium alimentarium]RCS81576.1 D-galactonate dehydratase family protein [Brachybacterium alimentarium]RCS83449.1 D-galactonate dehydratase family protein [Brachybacterium alimentarium]
MAIERIDVNVTSPGRNFVTVKVTTSDGVVGLGDGTLNGRELAVVSYLRDHVAPTLIGRDESAIEQTWQYLYRSPYWRRGPVTMAAISAIDMALWDIAAKKAGVPLYKLLGGASRTGLLTYAHASGTTIEKLNEAIHGYVEQGFQAVRIQAGVPGLDQIYGVHDSAPGGKYEYEPADRAETLGDGSAMRPTEETWDTRAYLRHLPTVFAGVREEFGPELRLLHDGHHRMSPIEAARLAKSLEPYDPFWLEDCTPGEDQDVLRLVRQHSVTPLAIGEVFNSVYDYQTLITERLIDYVRSSATHAGGITGLRQIMSFAAVYGIRSGFHGPTDVSPVGMAANLHLGLAIHNFGIQEFMPHSETTLSVFRTSYVFEDGLLHPGETPGLGVDLDEEAAAAHEYVPAYLPVNRLRDGSVHDW